MTAKQLLYLRITDSATTAENRALKSAGGAMSACGNDIMTAKRRTTGFESVSGGQEKCLKGVQNEEK